MRFFFFYLFIITGNANRVLLDATIHTPLAKTI